MIVFEYVTYKNFLSAGSAGITVALNTTSKTLVIGKNGAGKTTVIEAICFALFGKPFREINKPQLVNSVNKKACLVEIGFSIGSVQYKILRGIKPNKFEIYENEVLVNLESDTKDYQKILEKQILKMNFKTFTQIVVLGSSSYTPFMKLSAGNRREVIEDILDIKIFTTMNKLLKDRIKLTKDSLNDYETNLQILRNQLESQKKIIQNLLESKDNAVADVEANITANDDVIDKLRYEVDLLNAEIAIQAKKLEGKDKLEEKLQTSKITLSGKRNILTKNVKDIEFFEKHDNCIVCKQTITEEHKHDITTNLQTENIETENYITTLEEWVGKANSKLEEYNKTLNLMSLLNGEITDKNSTISTLGKQISLLHNKLKSNTVDDDKIATEKTTLNQIVIEGKKLSNLKNKVSEMRGIEDIAIQLLKDTAIKAAIIKEYLPVINKLINKHLGDMEFYANFELTENFEEVIKSRNRDEFSYASFSEGEKFRIDLAILFCWRDIAKMKNSLNTNLLIFDEVLDGVVDVSGVSFFLDYIGELKDTNTFVISHNDKAQEHFERIISFEKKGDFSIMEEK